MDITKQECVLICIFQANIQCGSGDIISTTL